MCQFNFFITKDKSNTLEIKEIASEFELDFKEIELDIVTSEKIWTFLTTRKSCDCGSVLGKEYRDESSEPDWIKEKKKLER